MENMKAQQLRYAHIIRFSILQDLLGIGNPE